MSSPDEKIVNSNKNISRGLNLRLKKFYFPAVTILAAVILSFMIHESGFELALDFPIDVSKEIEGSVDDSINWIVVTFGDFFDAVSDAIKVVLGKLRDLLVWIPYCWLQYEEGIAIAFVAITKVGPKWRPDCYIKPDSFR